MKKAKFLGTIIISDSNNRDLFRVHLFEDGARFDKSFALGILNNEEISDKVLHINNLWNDGRINKDGVVSNILKLLEEYDNILYPYYFTDEELDESGRYSGEQSVDFQDYNLDDIYHSVKNGKELPINQDSLDSYLVRLKQKKKLKRISRKLFETHLQNDELINFYVDNYSKKIAKFYSYELDAGEIIKNCYLMVVSDKIRIGILEK
jgi:hypothetical protein